MRRYMGMRGIGVEEGAKTSIHLATSHDVEGFTGLYFVDQRAELAMAAAREANAAATLWNMSDRLIGDPTTAS